MPQSSAASALLRPAARLLPGRPAVPAASFGVEASHTHEKLDKKSFNLGGPQTFAAAALQLAAPASPGRAASPHLLTAPAAGMRLFVPGRAGQHGPAWPILPDPPLPLGEASIVVSRDETGKVHLYNLATASDASIRAQCPTLLGQAHVTEWARNRAAVQLLARCCELGLSLQIGDLSRTAGRLPLDPGCVAALFRLAQARGVDPASITYWEHPLTAWRWPTDAFCQFRGAQVALQRLDALSGMPEVKRQLHELADSISYGLVCRAMGHTWRKPGLHMEFTGSPGTGKTTVARIYAHMLQSFGLLRSAQVMEVSREDLVASYLGQTAAKTRQVLDQARGGVLFIDEAYALITGESDTFGQEAVATLIKYMEDHRDDIVIVLAGYAQRMQALYEANEGLQSRISQRILFLDYDDNALLAVLRSMATAEGYSIDAALSEQLRDQVSRLRGPGFANARTMRNLCERAIGHHQARNRNQELQALAQGLQPARKLCLEDFSDALSSEEVSRLQRAMQALDALQGIAPAKAAIKKLCSSLRVNKARQSQGIRVALPSMHALFVGNPGTGKTTVARLYAQILAGCGVLPRGDIIEVRPSDLISGYMGQTEGKTRRILERALGSVLVVDEANRLVPDSSSASSYGRAALQEIMTFAEAHRGQIAVVLTCTRAHLTGLLAQEPNLARILGLQLEFPDFAEQELAGMLAQEVVRLGYRLDAGVNALALVRQHLRERALPGFGNGRAIAQLIARARANQDERLEPQLGNPNLSAAMLTTLRAEDFSEGTRPQA